eukprot:362982-Chlamydomonas_euryale.AAC.7
MLGWRSDASSAASSSGEPLPPGPPPSPSRSRGSVRVTHGAPPVRMPLSVGDPTSSSLTATGAPRQLARYTEPKWPRPSSRTRARSSARISGTPGGSGSGVAAAAAAAARSAEPVCLLHAPRLLHDPSDMQLSTRSKRSACGWQRSGTSAVAAAAAAALAVTAARCRLPDDSS